METDTKDLGSKDPGSKDQNEEGTEEGKKEWPKVIIPKDPSLYPGFPDTEGKNLSIKGNGTQRTKARWLYFRKYNSFFKSPKKNIPKKLS